MNKTIAYFITLFAVSFFAASAKAQKLPNVQTASLRLPANLKVDGKFTEWGGVFQAYNKSTQLYYTLANDDETLYLAVQIADPRTIEKAIIAGISLVFKNGDNKENVRVTYPNVKQDFTRSILSNAGDQDHWPGLPHPGNLFAAQLTRTDSTVAIANQRLALQTKNITVIGLKGLQDSLISIYNDENIKVAVHFENNGKFNYELSIPLKFLNIAASDIKKTKYQIRLNDCSDYVAESTYRSTNPTSGTAEQADANPDLDAVTKFDGEYTLAKKP